MTTQQFLKEIGQLGPASVIPFVGSGFVLDAGFPSWENLLLSTSEFVKKHNEALAGLIRSRTISGDYLGAGDLVFETEVPKSELFIFFRSVFDKQAILQPIHTELARCPFPAFITTNFDRTIEQALTKMGKTPEPIAESNRFGRFNSRLSVYSEVDPATLSRQYAGQIPLRVKNGMILKLHSDITCPEEMILGDRQFKSLLSSDAFNFLYRRLLSSYTLLFLGYSGNDPVFRWHCETLLSICGTPPRSSYFLQPDDEPMPAWLKEANIIRVPYSRKDNYKELFDTVRHFAMSFTSAGTQQFIPFTEFATQSTLHSLAFLCFGLTDQVYASSYQCAINSMIAEASLKIGTLDDVPKIADHISRTYHIPIVDAYALVQQSDRIQTKEMLASTQNAQTRLEGSIQILAEGLTSRAKAMDIPYHNKSILRQIILEVLVKALSQYGNALSLSLIDVDPPESTLVDRVIRASINQLHIQGIGSLDKEVLSTSFADIFIHPSKEEGSALLLLAQAALAHSLASTFSGGIGKIQQLMPSDVFLDSNVSIPLVAKDHPRSSYYHELVVRLLRAGCDIFILDKFLDEMQNHCRLAYEELQVAGIENGSQAKEYAEFHGPLWINAFISAYSLGGRPTETFPEYLKRVFKSDIPKEADFKRVLGELGVVVINTNSLNSSQSVSLSIHISTEKRMLTRVKAQVLADHEALQILYLHQVAKGNAWFITEDVALRRILRNLPKTTFSSYPPSRGVMPAQGAYLLITSLSERPSLQGTFVQFLWNPLYVEMVDSMMADVIRKMPDKIKILKERGFASLREKVIELMQMEMDRSEKNDIHRRAKEFKLGRPEMVQSILKLIGEK